MISFASVLGPFHLLSYSTLLGTQLYQTFIITKVAYIALPRSAFTTLQKRLFPIYFQCQSSLLLLTLLSVPPAGPMSLLRSVHTWVPFAAAGATAALNLCLYGPRTRQIMMGRIHQNTRDGKKTTADDPAKPSPEMQALNRDFSSAHAMSIHLNLVTIAATIYYGLTLASRLQFSS
ncbi:hypothetical protein F5X68DRAFT_261771 [Plectosphaerella plurivora]|uniref:TMEM205-like domain-containing protein n=1 Tax=Plectosphaerella plurivora TaxID=936078 RepID=A0A9P8VAR1_9PEZI|nr:hypothetical protein F5X68DRAFT_261771 [Plectosphaerella plurivora]